MTTIICELPLHLISKSRIINLRFICTNLHFILRKVEFLWENTENSTFHRVKVFQTDVKNNEWYNPNEQIGTSFIFLTIYDHCGLVSRQKFEFNCCIECVVVYGYNFTREFLRKFSVYFRILEMNIKGVLYFVIRAISKPLLLNPSRKLSRSCLRYISRLKTVFY